jgi:DNA primase
MRVLPFNEALTVVKATIDILDVVGRHVALKKAGRNYLGLCPFHGEKTPSFNVNREKNLFKCFGCGEHGDAIAFLMKLEHKPFPEVIRELARDQGIEIHDDPATAAQAQARKTEQALLLAVNQAAHQWFVAQLANTAHPEHATLQAYLNQRGLNEAWCQYFGLGFALPGWDHLTTHLRQTLPEVQQQPTLLESAGLATARPEQHAHQSGHYDKFRHRLMVPIHNLQGQVVAFGGRVLTPDDKPKYLNSPETPVYHKSDTLYAAHLAKDAIRRQKAALIMEGYFDVMAAHMAGFQHTVGVCGTALTESHLKQLVRLGAETIVLAFDADEAGLKAAHSAIDLVVQSLKNTPLEVKVLSIPSGKDPDDFLRSHPPEAFQGLIDQAKPFLQFQLDQALRGIDRHSVEGRVTAASRLTPILAKIRQPVLRAELTRLYAERVGISNDALATEVRHHARQQQWAQRQQRPSLPIEADTPLSPDSPELALASDVSLPRHPTGVSLPPYTPGLSGGFRSKLPDKKWGKGNYSNQRKPYGSKANSGPPTSLEVPGLRLPPKHLAAELNLWRLMFYADEAFVALWPLVQSQTFESPALHGLQQALGTLAECPCTTQTLLDTLQSTLRDTAPEVVRQAFDLAFDTDTFGQPLGLGQLSGPRLVERVQDLAWQQVEIIEQHQQRQRLQGLNARVRQSETSAIPETASDLDDPRVLQHQLIHELRP